MQKKQTKNYGSYGNTVREMKRGRKRGRVVLGFRVHGETSR